MKNLDFFISQIIHHSVIDATLHDFRKTRENRDRAVVRRLLGVATFVKVYDPRRLEKSGKDSVLKARIDDMCDDADSYP